MNCQAFEELLVIRAYGKLRSDDEKKLTSHARRCARCARLLARIEKSGGLFQPSDEIPEPDWERSWQVIANKVCKGKKSFQVYIPRPLLAALALLLIFMAGFFLGKQFRLWQPKSSVVYKTNGDEISIQSYAETVESIVLDYLNHGGAHDSNDYLSLQQKYVRRMLLATRRLRIVFARQNKFELVQLVDQIEFLLLNMANLEPTAEPSRRYIRTLLSKKDLIERLKHIASENRNI